jgi:hypothetical protein
MADYRPRTVGQMKKLTNLMELSNTQEAISCATTQEIHEVSLPHSLEPLIGAYPEPDQSSPYNTILSLKDSELHIWLCKISKRFITIHKFTKNFKCYFIKSINKTKKKTPWPLVRERTVPTERPSLVDEI